MLSVGILTTPVFESGFPARRYSMHKVIQHDALAAGILNYDYTGGVGQYMTWKDDLGNNKELLETISQRLKSDYEALNPKMRKAFALKDLDTWWDLTTPQS